MAREGQPRLGHCRPRAPRSQRKKLQPTSLTPHAWSVQRPTYCQPPALTDHDTTKLRDLRSVLVDGLAGVPVGHLDQFFGVVQFAATGAAERSRANAVIASFFIF